MMSVYYNVSYYFHISVQTLQAIHSNWWYGDQNVSVLGSHWNAVHCLLGQLSHSNFYGSLVCQASNSKLIILKFRIPIGTVKHDNTFAVSSHLSIQQFFLFTCLFREPQQTNFLFLSTHLATLNTAIFLSHLLCPKACPGKSIFNTCYARKVSKRKFFYPTYMSGESYTI